MTAGVASYRSDICAMRCERSRPRGADRTLAACYSKVCPAGQAAVCFDGKIQ